MHEIKQWYPDRPVSRGAIAYHKAVVNAPYYTEVLDVLMDIMDAKIKEDEVVVDFGAGTGVSALRLFNKVKKNFNLWLVDNSAAWLGNAHEIFKSNEKVECFLLCKTDGHYATLAETVGTEVADHVVCANTVHLIPDIKDTFKGIYDSLKKKGTFTFQSGNIDNKNRKKGVLMVDDTVKKVREMALDIVRINKRFKKYTEGLDKKIEMENRQQKFVFPDPRPAETYLDALKASKFTFEMPTFKTFKVAYKDWMNFLRVKRLQAGILPEIGGKDPSPEEEEDRDRLIVMSAEKLFGDLAANNPMADATHYTIECAYFTAFKTS